jgi:hypothetical protein
MKITSTKLLSTIFLFALAAAPLRAQTNVAADTNANRVSPATNNSVADAQQNPADETTAPVRIDGSGVHIGGQNPVDIGPSSFGQTMTAIVAIIAGCSIPIAIVALVGLNLYFRQRRNRMLHETLRAMIDKGVPIPPELFSKSELEKKQRPRNDLRTGLILIGLGAGVVILFNNHRAGFIVLFMGAAFLLASFLEKKNNRNDQPPK